MGCCLAMGWASVITGAGWGMAAVHKEKYVTENDVMYVNEADKSTDNGNSWWAIAILDKGKAHQLYT